MSKSLKNFVNEEKKARTETPQNKRTPGRTDEVKNNAGGFVFKVSDQARLERFLILGTDGATYYVNSQAQVKDNLGFLRNMIKSNEADVLKTVIQVSDEGRAYSNSPAIFALAVLLSEAEDKAAVRAAVNKVVRTGTHLFEFAGYIDALGGWGRGKRAAIAEWYINKDAESLAYQAVKYRQRNGWTHRDLFRKAHPDPKKVDSNVASFILGKGDREYQAVPILDGFDEMQKAGTVKEVIRGLETYKNLPWETIPTEHLKDAKVWKTLFYNGQLNGQALIRNITRLAKLGAFKDMQFAADYAARLTDENMIRKTRLHPINFLNAIVVYTEGQMPRADSYGYRGYGRQKDWVSESVIVDALNEGFYTAFKTIEPAGKRTMLAIDVSGSMSSPALGLDLSCAQVSGAMAMTVARTEPAHIIRGFTSSGGGWATRGNAQLTDLGISARTELSSAMTKVRKNNFGGTDCAQPMLWALENDVEVDTFVVITDNETWAGAIKPAQALVKYRKETGIDARLAVLGVAASPFTIADPNDRGMMDFVGFDSNAPRVLADFSAGRI